MMKNDSDYKQAKELAKVNFANARERGEDALGDWDELRKSFSRRRKLPPVTCV